MNDQMGPGCVRRAHALAAAAAALLMLGLPGTSLAGNQQVRINAIMAGLNGDSRIQYIELEYRFSDNEWGPQGAETESRALLEFHDGTGVSTGVYEFPSDPSNSYALVGSPAFATTFPGVPLDFELPAPMVVGVDGMVCFRRNPAGSGSGIEDVNFCVSYGDFHGTPEEQNDCGTATGPPVYPRVAMSNDRGLPIAADPGTFTSFPALVEQSGDFRCLTEPPSSPGSGTNGNFVLSEYAPRNGAGDVLALSETLTTPLEQQGENVFNFETFDGNGRTCVTCHDPVDSFGLSPGTVAAKAATDPNCGPMSDISCDPLFVHLTQPTELSLLEDACLLEQGNFRGLILENIDSFAENPVFRSTPHLVNIANTAPYGMGFCPGPNCKLVADLQEFCMGAIEQHFPKAFDPTTFERNSDPSSGLPLDFRAPADIELMAMELFQNDIDFPEKPFIDTTGSTVEERRDNTIDALVAAAIAGGGNATFINEGRALFFGDGQCFRCHDGEALDRSLVGFSTGMVDHFDVGTGSDGGSDTMTNITANTNDGCDSGVFDPTLPLPAEASGAREFNTMGLIGIARTAPFFHDGSAPTMFDAVRHYNTPNFDFSESGLALAMEGNAISINGAEIQRITAFVEALTFVPEPGSLLLQGFALATLVGLRRRWDRGDR